MSLQGRRQSAAKCLNHWAAGIITSPSLLWVLRPKKKKKLSHRVLTFLTWRWQITTAAVFTVQFTVLLQWKRFEEIKAETLTTLRVNFSREVRRPCSVSGWWVENKKRRGEKSHEGRIFKCSCSHLRTDSFHHILAFTDYCSLTFLWQRRKILSSIIKRLLAVVNAVLLTHSLYTEETLDKFTLFPGLEELPPSGMHQEYKMHFTPISVQSHKIYNEIFTGSDFAEPDEN